MGTMTLSEHVNEFNSTGRTRKHLVRVLVGLLMPLHKFSVCMSTSSIKLVGQGGT